ncbi:MAG: hypothetical protein M3546_04830 [Actinomycetota bacterium]|nr:hypothetical protein [Actinomycetota bacterium]
MKRILLVLLAVGALAASAATATASNGAIVLSFEKQGSVVDSHYVGTATGGVTVDMQLSDKYYTGNVQHFTATMRLEWPDGRVLTALLDGRFNGSTGKTVLNGEVVSGWLAGAQVHEEGQLVAFDSTTLVATFVGTVQLMPGSAD